MDTNSQECAYGPTHYKLYSHGSNVSTLDRTSRDVVLNVSYGYRFGLVALTSLSHLDAVTLTSRSRLGLGIIQARLQFTNIERSKIFRVYIVGQLASKVKVRV